MSPVASRLAMLSGLALVLAGAGVGHANGSHDGPGRAEPATGFEAFLDGACTPCVRVSFLVTTVAVSRS